jgi:Ca-activated chloride channel homolog
VTIHFAYPWVLLLLLFVPLYLIVHFRGGRRALPLPRSSQLARARNGSGWALGSAQELLRALAIALLIVGLARPRTAGAVIEEHGEGIPIMIAFDLSSSMLAEDFAPSNRLEVARETTREFIRGRRYDPMGLVAFAGEAITQVPLTMDRRVLSAALDNLQIGLLEDGTAIGMGLATAVARLQRVDAESRVIVLLSDGENNRGEIEPLEAAHAGAVQGIRVFTVGVGSDEAAPVPLRRGPGGVIQYAELPVGIDEPLLREIAAVTGGAYFRADRPDALQSVFRELDRLVATPLETRRHVQHTEWYLLLVLLGTAAFLSEWFLRGSRWGRLP